MQVQSLRSPAVSKKSEFSNVSAGGRDADAGHRPHESLEQEAIRSRCRRLEAVVAMAFGHSVEDLRRPSRGKAPVAFARQVAMYLAHVEFALSLTEVGRRFERDRTTVAHACRLVEERRDDPRVDRLVSAIESAFDLRDRSDRSREYQSRKESIMLSTFAVAPSAPS